MSLRLGSVATSLRTRLAAVLALVMLGPVLVAVIAIGLVVPARARTTAEMSAARDADSAALTLATRCQAIGDAATAFARQVAQYADRYDPLPADVAQQAANAAVANRPGLAAAVLDASGTTLAADQESLHDHGQGLGQEHAAAGGYGSSCAAGTAGRRPDLTALSEARPVNVRRGSSTVEVGTVVLWETVDQNLLTGLAHGIGSDGQLQALPINTPQRHQARYVENGTAYVTRAAGPGLPFRLQAQQPVGGAGLAWALVAVVLAAAVIALVFTRNLADRLTRRLAALTGTADRLRNGDLAARSDVQVTARSDEVGKLARALDEMASELQLTIEKHEEARRLSVTDPLTGVGNVRQLSTTLSREVERATRFDRPLTVLMLDLDHFKQINDSLGHGFGDAVLRDFAQRVRNCLREVDTVARYGGEEFALVLPETDVDGGCRAAERVIEAVRARPFGMDGVYRPVTVSIGVASFPNHARSAADILRSADQALYAAKTAGRDRWIVATVSAEPAVSVPQAG